jgi:hypothetical protein
LRSPDRDACPNRWPQWCRAPSSTRPRQAQKRQWRGHPRTKDRKPTPVRCGSLSCSPPTIAQCDEAGMLSNEVRPIK